MKKLLALLLCLILCLSLFACNKAEEPTETEAPTETERPTETGSEILDMTEFKKLNVNLVAEGKMVFPDKEISYMSYEKWIRDGTPVGYDVIRKEKYEDVDKIKEILSCLEGSALTSGAQPLFTQNHFGIYYTDNTYVSFSIAVGGCIVFSYSNEVGENISEYYRMSDYEYQTLTALLQK